ncbi:MAG TPA: Cof-type HAD-IIB family hydrolase [Ktedonobacteraceae bacterium]|nr:Cof-type HAD-IIB family hydrolase [Ktedonobacteraceae bacterium]
MNAIPESIKLIVIDIDGTLLNPQQKITPPTQKAIREARDMGIIVTLATARRYEGTREIIDKLQLEHPIILFDGAELIDPINKKVVLTQTLPAEIGQEAVNLLVKHDIAPIVHPAVGINEEIWINPEGRDDLWASAYLMMNPEQIRRFPVEELCTGKPDPLRVVAFAPEENINALIPEAKQLPCDWTTIKRGNYGSAEISFLGQGTSKATAMQALAKMYKIPMTQVMALGDNNNDFAMLKAAGWGVAMGQAPEAVKAAASAVTASNQEDGVALAIERYALRASTNARSNSLKRVI